MVVILGCGLGSVIVGSVSGRKFCELSVRGQLRDYQEADDEYCIVFLYLMLEEVGIPVLSPGYGYFSYHSRNI
jgi:hypothetical protein